MPGIRRPGNSHKSNLPLDFVKFIVDAQLPQLLSSWLNTRGFDAIHTLALPAGNRSHDKENIALADREGRIVISKDSDFLEDHILSGTPKKLLIVRTSNIKNETLLLLFEKNIERLVSLLTLYNLVEINRTDIIVHS